MKLIYLVLSIIVISNNSFAQNNNFSQIVSEKLIKIVTSTNEITRSDYNDFWNSTGIKSRQAKINLILQMKSNFVLVQEYNKILWECAEKSWNFSKVIDCQKIDKKYNDIRKSLNDLIGDDEFGKVESNFNNIISISAKRGVGNFSGVIEPVTLEKIQLAKLNSQLILQKIDIIMQPDFR